MRDDKKVACVRFNSGTFQGYDDAKTVLIEVIVSELIMRVMFFVSRRTTEVPA
jgi:hypothetical protein